jgi:predicted membrane protein
MFDFGQIVLVIFILIRILIAAGLLYLIIQEIRRHRKRKVREEESENATNGKDIDRTNRSRK